MRPLRIQQSIAATANTRQREAQFLGSTVEQFGNVTVTGIGEVIHPILFLYEFIERPIVTGSGLLLDGIVEVGRFPTCSVMWQTLTPKLLSSGKTHYTGGNLIIVVTGRAVADGALGQVTVVDFRIVGRAIKNPGSAPLSTPI